MKPGELGAERMNPVREERASAAAQIQRSLKAWRAANGPAGKANIPQGGGNALPGEVRTRMEPKLGADLSGVRVHTGGDSARAAGQLGARAFTVGSDVHFNSGEFSPGSKEGDRLLAHELTHVVQGQKSGVQRKAADESEGEEKENEVSDPAEPAEKEADAVADEVTDDLHAGDEKKEGGAEAKQSKEAAKDASKEKKANQEKKEQKAKDGEEGGKEAEGEEPGADKADAKADAGADKGDAKADAGAEKGGGKADAGAEAKGGEEGGKEAEGEEKPAKIAAKLEGVGFKIHRNPNPNPNPNAAPNVDPAKQAQIDKAKACQAPADVDAFCTPDPIAVQKLSDVKGETNMEGGNNAGAKTGFYTALAGWIQSNAETVNPATIFNQCFNNLAGPWKFKGTKINVAQIGNAMQRTQGMGGFYHTAIDKPYYENLAAGSPNPAQTAYDLWKNDAKNGNVLAHKNAGGMINPANGTWFTPDSYKLSSGGDAGFQELLELAALQPEWFPEGNIKFEVDSAQAAGTMEARKPTAYDGMQSSLWVSRPTGDTFGVTGGGANEFLAKGVPVSAIKNASAVIPDASTINDLKAAIQAARDTALNADPQLKAAIDAAPANSQAKKDLENMIPNLTDMFMRGTATMPMSAHIREMLQSIKSTTDAERANPSAPRAAGTITAPSHP